MKLRGNEIEAFLAHLAVDRKVAASTQDQALSALLFLDTVRFVISGVQKAPKQSIIYVLPHLEVPSPL